MRKRIVSRAEQQRPTLPNESWLDIERLADVELSSEDPDHPIESALLPTDGAGLPTEAAGWRAAEAGPQSIRLVFTKPQYIRRIWIEFIEPLAQRTQQFVLRWSADGGQSFNEIVRQQWNFSPPAATHETEDYHVDLREVSIIELTINPDMSGIPDMSGGGARATLTRLRFA